MSAVDLNPHVNPMRYMCRVCKEPLGFPTPSLIGWVCPDDDNRSVVAIALADVVKMVDLDLLHQLWHDAAGFRPWQIDGIPARRQTWVAHAYVKARPEHGHDTTIYKVIERLGVGSLTLTPEQITAAASNTKFRKGLIP